LHRKGLVIGMLILMIGVNIGNTFAGDVDVKTISSAGFDGNTLYVGGSGPNNHTVIQEAVDNASHGDTVFVYSGIYSHYFASNWACVRIDKRICLLGEDRDNTIINGSGSMRVVYIRASGVIISGFTLQHGGDPYQYGAFGRGVDAIQHLSDIQIFNNIIQENYQAIGVQWETTDVSIHDNIIRGNYDGFDNGADTFRLDIFNNTFSDNDIGLPLSGNDFHVHHNIFVNNLVGIELYNGKFDSVIEHNHFQNNGVGIHLLITRSTIQKNNFVGNTQHIDLYKGATFLLIPILPLFRQRWRNNYWDDWNSTQPRPIRGEWGLHIFMPIPKPYALLIAMIPYVEYDWRPSQQPYDIGV